MKRVIFVLLLITPAEAAFAKNANQRKCYPYCERYTIDQLKNLDLAAILPERPELYRYRVKGTYGGDVYFKDKVPVYTTGRFEAFRQQGWIAIGKEIKLEHLTSIAHRMFYRVNLGKDENGLPKYGWIDGMFVEAYGTNY